VEWKPLSDLERRLGFPILTPWVKTNDDEITKMFEGIIPKEYSTNCMESTDNVVISQQDRTKDSKEK